MDRLGLKSFFRITDQDEAIKTSPANPRRTFCGGITEAFRASWVMLMNNGGIEKPDDYGDADSGSAGEIPKMQRWQLARVEVRLYSKD